MEPARATRWTHLGALAVGAGAAAFVIGGRADSHADTPPTPQVRSNVVTYVGRGSDGGRITARYDSRRLYWSLVSPFTRDCQPAPAWMEADTTFDWAPIGDDEVFADAGSYWRRRTVNGRPGWRQTTVRLNARRTATNLRGSYRRYDAFFEGDRFRFACRHTASFDLRTTSPRPPA